MQLYRNCYSKSQVAKFMRTQINLNFGNYRIIPACNENVVIERTFVGRYYQISVIWNQYISLIINSDFIIRYDFFTFFFFVSLFFDAEYNFCCIKTKAPLTIDALLEFWKHLLIIPPELRCKFNTEIIDTYASANYMVQNRDWCGNLWAHCKVIWFFNESGANFEFHFDKDNDNHELLI